MRNSLLKQIEMGALERVHALHLWFPSVLLLAPPSFLLRLFAQVSLLRAWSEDLCCVTVTTTTSQACLPPVYILQEWQWLPAGRKSPWFSPVQQASFSLNPKRSSAIISCSTSSPGFLEISLGSIELDCGSQVDNIRVHWIRSVVHLAQHPVIQSCQPLTLEGQQHDVEAEAFPWCPLEQVFRSFLPLNAEVPFNHYGQ